jgi:hypothetical protein
MANEITAEMLAASVAGPECDYNAKTLIFAERFLAFSRALASLQAERAQQCGHPYCGETCGSPNDAPDRVRCWAVVDKATGRIVEVHTTFRSFSPNMPYAVTEGYFTAKGSTDD